MKLAEEVRMGYIKNLVRSGHPTYFGRDRLTDTITANVTVDGHSFSATLRMNKYWEYLEEGTKPHWPPSSAIAKWIEVKPLIPRPDGAGRIPTPKQLAFLIGRSMAGKSPNQANLKNPNGGTTGTHGLERAKEEVIPRYYTLIEEALTADIGDYLWKMISW